jgi:hypothetical protein
LDTSCNRQIGRQLVVVSDMAVGDIIGN